MKVTNLVALLAALLLTAAEFLVFEYDARQNVVLYVKNDSPWITALSSAHWITDSSEVARLDVIHPEKWQQCNDVRNLGLSKIIRAFPNAVSMALRKRFA